MHACIICSRHDEAFALFSELVDGPLLAGSEWQWGGGSHALDPSCRDMAMRALGECTQETDSSSFVAMKLFREVEENGPLSMDALKGVVRACERDGNWEDAVSVLHTMVDRCNDPSWLVTSDQLSPILSSEPIRKEKPFSQQTILEDVLSSVMRNCNASGRFGLALLCGRLVDVALLSREIKIISIGVAENAEHFGEGTELEQSLLPLVFGMSQSEDILVSVMVSLCGLGCCDRAVSLYEMALGLQERNGDEVNPGPTSRWSDAEECCRYAQSLAADTDLSLEKAWESAHRHIHRLTAAAHSIANSGHEISPEQKDLLAFAVARTMQCCTAAGHPETGIYLAKRVDDVISIHPVRGAVSSFFGLGEWARTDRSNDFNSYNDTILAHTIGAYRASGWDNEVPLESRADVSTQSANETLRALVTDRHFEDATVLYNEMDIEVRNPETFYIMAKGLASEKQWHGVGDLYAQSLSHGCLSEELGLLAMKSIVDSSLDGRSKLRVLRSIISETSRISGVDAKQWQQLRYWTLKRALGWHHARLLMWWNEEDSSRRAELELAIQQFEERKTSLLKPKNDVIKCIVNGVRQLNEGGEADSNEDFVSQRDRSEWRDLLLRVLDESSRTSVRSDPRFATDVVLAFRALHGNAECIEYLRDAVNRGVQISNTVLEEAINAAEEDGDFGSDLGILFARRPHEDNS